MEVKVIFSLGEGDASTLSELLAVLAKGQITSPKHNQESEAEATHFEIVEESKPAKKTSKSKLKKAESKDTTVAEEENVEIHEEETKHASLEDIRMIARKLADEGRQKEYKPILEKYGYAKVNLIEEKDYDDIYSEMSKLVGEDNA